MSFLLLFNDSDGGGSPPPVGEGVTLDCLVDLFWLEAQAECAALTGAFATIPSLTTIAHVIGHSELSATVEFHTFACSALMASTCILDCAAIMPSVDGYMTVSPAFGVDASVFLPCVTALAEIYRIGAALSADVFMPCVQASAFMIDMSAYDFGVEADLILRYETKRRLI